MKWLPLFTICKIRAEVCSYMPKQNSKERRAQEKRPAATESTASIVLAGAICLAIGLGIGYYFGLQSASTVPPASSSLPATPLANPSSFLQSEASLKAALASNPSDRNTLLELGNLYYDNGRFKEAVDYYGRVLDIDPKNCDVRTDRGTSYWNLGQADAAIAEFKKALAVDPAHAQTLYNLGVVYLSGKNDPAGARKTWEKLLSTNPGYPDRAKVQEQLAALSTAKAADTGASGPSAGGAAGVEDLLQRMKTHR
jgi:tetratricopeptide (TPR) repeat protein